jgi:sugar lactone lactonase YvrE
MELRTAKLSDRRQPATRRRWVALALTVMLLATLVAPATAAGKPFPEQIPLPVPFEPSGFRPEGITIGFGTQFFVGSIPTGAIYTGDLRTGEGELLVEPQEGRAAIGMKVDERSGYLFVAGGPTGMAFVYDARTGANIAEYLLDAEAPRFINDVALTQDAAYFTNSNEAEIYRLPLGAQGRPVEGAVVETIPLTGEWQQIPNAFNANGIVATPGGQWLIIVNSTEGALFRVDPETGAAIRIDVDYSFASGDGLWLQGHTLWVVQNRLNQVAVVQLNANFSTGTVVDTITSPLFDVPTTIAPFGNAFYAVNARFTTPPTPDTAYNIVRFEKK